MSELLVQGCSKRKLDIDQKVKPQRLYDGYFFRILDNNKPERTTPLSVVVLSAEHGLLTPADRVGPYDTQMSSSRAAELNSEVLSRLEEYTQDKQFERIWVNVGKTYLQALDGIESVVEPEVRYLSGRLGERGKQLKQLARGQVDSPCLLPASK